MAEEYRYKIRLKDTKFPVGGSTATAYLYPVSPIDGLVESAENPINAYNTVTINDGSATRSIGRIKAEYLDIILNDSGYATGNYHINNNYLNFIETVTINGAATQKIQNNFLNIWSTTEGSVAHPLIDKQYLPGYVDDVIDVQVLESGYPEQPPAGTKGLFIRKSGTTYTFMTWNEDQAEWVPGGGELGKIYVDTTSGSGDMFRAVAVGGEVSTTAVLISASPLNIMTTDTNGVHLYKDGNNNVYAQAYTANGGLLRYGTVITANQEEQYQDLKEVQQLSIFSIVPTVEYVKTLVSHASITLTAGNAISAVPLAGGTVACLTATSGQQGVVRTIASLAGSVYDADQVPTPDAVRTYVSTALTGYQPKLTEGNGIDITNNVISVEITSDPWMSCTANGLTVNPATSEVKGVVRTVTAVNANYSTDEAIAAHPEGVVSFVKSMIENMTYSTPNAWVTVKNPTITYNTSTHVLAVTGGSISVAVATTATEGVVKLSDTIGGSEVAGGTVAVTPYAVTQAIAGKQPKLTAGYAIDATQLAGGTAAVYPATTAQAGAVTLVTVLGQTAYATNAVPTPAAVEAWAASIQPAPYVGSSGVEITGTTVIKAVVDSTNYPWMALGANGIGVSSATDGNTGVVKLSQDIDTTETAANMKKMVPSIYGVTAYVGGIQTTLQNNIDKKQDAFTLGNGLTSSYVAATGTTISAAVQSTQAWMQLDANGIGVSSATVDTKAGVVYVKGTVDTVSPYTTAVPTVSAVKKYVDDSVSGLQEELSFTSGTSKSGTTVKAVINTTTYPWMALDANGLGVSSATVDTSAGVVFVKGTVDTASPYTTAVPTVSAVKKYVDDSVSGLQDELTFTSGTSLTGTTVKAVVNTDNYPWMQLNAAGIGVASANVTTGVAGVVAVVTGLTVGGAYTDVQVPNAAAVLSLVSGKQDALTFSAGVTKTGTTVSAYRLPNTVVSGNIALDTDRLYTETANATHTGAVRIPSGGNITLETNGSGGISVRPATTGQDGTVTLASEIGTSPSTTDVPPASLVSSYVEGQLLGYLSYELMP